MCGGKACNFRDGDAKLYENKDKPEYRLPNNRIKETLNYIRNNRIYLSLNPEVNVDFIYIKNRETDAALIMKEHAPMYY